MIDFVNQSNIAVDITLLEKIATRISDKDVELIIMHDQDMRILNKKYRNKDKSTDVLSFPLNDFGVKEILLGSIVICIDEASRAAKLYKHNLEYELALLFVHGMLHLLGYDHENDCGEHRDVEEKLLAEFGLPDSLIIRAGM